MEKGNAENLALPPCTNRGVENTYRDGLNALVDWVQGTFKFVQDARKIISLFELDELPFKATKGKYGYAFCVRHRNIAFYFGGQEGMGVHFEFSGDGCRQFETFKDYSWQDFFQKIIDNEGKLTRLDLAIDDIVFSHSERKKLFFDISNLERRLKKGLVTSKFRRARHLETIDIKKGVAAGKTLYFGSPQSLIQVRFYEKDWERMLKGHTLLNSVVGWNRIEIQSRDDRANEFAILIAENRRTLGDLICGVLRNYINFHVEGDKDKNRSRRKIAKFWTDFLNNAEKIQLSQKFEDVTIEKKYEWIKNSVEKSLAMVFAAHDGNMKLVEGIIKSGMDKITKEDEKIILDYVDKKIDWEKIPPPLKAERNNQLIRLYQIC